MRTRLPASPAGYRAGHVGTAVIVVREDAYEEIRDIVGSGQTLHGWARARPEAVRFQGRAPVYGVTLPGRALDIVVRHAWHGGLLAPITLDLFRWPSGAPRELEISEQLRRAGIATPTVVAYVVYPAGLGFCRADIATERLGAGGDLPALWPHASPAQRSAMMHATGRLVATLADIGAHHEDLNVKNVHLIPEGDAYRAYALDVDRVRFGRPHALDANLSRLARSLRKARVQFGLAVRDADIAQLRAAAGAVS